MASDYINCLDSSCRTILPVSGLEILPPEWSASFLLTGQSIAVKPLSKNSSQNSTYLRTSRSVRLPSPSITQSALDGQMEKCQSEGGPKLMDLQQVHAKWGRVQDVILLRITWGTRTGKKSLEWVSNGSLCQRYTNLYTMNIQATPFCGRSRRPSRCVLHTLVSWSSLRV